MTDWVANLAPPLFAILICAGNLWLTRRCTLAATVSPDKEKVASDE